MSSAEIVLVGAGPVGLWTALQVKKRLPDARVTVYERHTQYQRSHILRLDHWSLLHYSRINLSASEQEFYQDVTGKRVGRVQMSFAKSLYLRTNDLEAALRAYALREGISIVYRKIESAAEVQALHPNCTVFIACDGAHSRLRTELLGPDAVTRYDMQHVVELKFEEQGEPRRFDVKQKWGVNKALHFAGSDHVGRKRGENTPVTLRLLLDAATYNQLPEMSFKGPLSLDSPGIPETVRANIQTYLRHREELLGSKLVEGSCKLSKLILSAYAAKHFGIHQGERAWFLVGDAAMGVPYFRALNCGMMLGGRLAMLLGRNGGLEPKHLGRLVGRFERRRLCHMAVEFGIAMAKDVGLNVVKDVRARYAMPEGPQ